MGWATLAVLLVAYESPGSAQQMVNKMSDVADQLRTELAGEPVTVRQHGSRDALLRARTLCSRRGAGS